MANSQLATLEHFLEKHPHITYATPSSPNYASLRQIFTRDQHATPLAIIRPKSAIDVSLLVKFAVSNSIKFTIRTGGHNLSGACFAQDALAIDMRDIAYVKTASDKRTARIGGGILQLDLAIELEKDGLATPTGTIACVGYTGWATYGGYGMFSNQWGLGVDQIVGAKVVNAKGDIVEADKRLLKGLRGGGGLFGVIVELTIRVYTLRKIFSGMLILASQDIGATFKTFNTAYEELSAKALPSELVLQQLVVNSPQGRAICISFTWSSEDIETGRTWLSKVEGLAPVAMSTVMETTIPDLLIANAALVPKSVHGVSYTHNVRKITSEVATIIGDSLAEMSDDAGCMFAIHELKGPSAAPHSDSVYGNRDPHFMLEILGYSTTEENRNPAQIWAENTWSKLLQIDGSNLLPGTYISIDRPATKPASVPLSRLYGSNDQDLRAMKKEFDSENVFSLAIPQLQNYS